MRKLLFGLFTITFLFGCDKDSKPSSNEALMALQSRSNTTQYKDSIYIYLKEGELIYKNHSTVLDSLKAENNFLLGLYFEKENQLDSASVYFYKSISFVDKTTATSSKIKYFKNCWDAFFLQEKYGEAHAISEKFRKIIDTDDFELLSYYYHFLSNEFWETGDFKNAKKYNQKRIDALKKIGDTIKILPAYFFQTKLYHITNQDPYLLLDSLVNNSENMSFDFKRQLFGNYGVHKFFDKQYTEAIFYYKKSIANTKKTPETFDKVDLLANGYNNVAEAYLEMEDFENASIYLDSTEQLGIGRIASKYQKSFLKYKSRLLFSTTKNPSNAIRYLDTVFKYRDLQYQEKTDKELLSLSEAYEKEKQLITENRITEVQNIQLQNRLLIITAITIVLILVGFLIYSRRKQKFKTESLQMQQRLLRSQMNPHFTFNTLYAIQHKIQKSPEIASKYLLKFSRLLRLILENSISNNVQLKNEIESLEKYLELQLLRFPNKFTYVIHFKNLDRDDPIFIPPMLIQPFVENSIEHGFKNSKQKGHIEITLTLQKRFIFCEVFDTGIWDSKNEKNEKKSTSFQLISDFLYKTTKQKISVKKINTPLGTGTRVAFLIPYKITEDD